jgi:hypothetical protein
MDEDFDEMYQEVITITPGILALIHEVVRLVSEDDDISTEETLLYMHEALGKLSGTQGMTH